MSFSWLFVAGSMQGQIRGELNHTFNGVSTDSRTIRQGELYFALSGEQFDGHRFAGAAVQNGAAAAVVRKDLCTDVFPRIEVDDPLKALQRLGGAYRARWSIPVIAITGSHGKTTTKDFLASIISRTRKTRSTFQNLNGLIGVPLTLLQLKLEDQALVIEVGISKPGEMDILSRIVRPSDAIFTCVAPAHSEFMPSLDVIANEKKKLFDQIQPGGHAILNADDPMIMNACSCSNSIFYGIHSGDYRAHDIRTDSAGSTFLVTGPNGDKHLFTLPRHGRHNVYNALAAIAMARTYQISPKTIQAGLDTATLSPHRSHIIRRNCLTIIDDTYNAAPESMRCALQVLNDYPAEETVRRVAMLGDMLELGECSRSEHAELGRNLADYSIDLLVAFGEETRFLYQEAYKAGINCLHFPNVETIVRDIADIVNQNDLVLVKASRSMRGEKIITALLNIFP